MGEEGVHGCSMFGHGLGRAMTFAEFQTKRGKEANVEQWGLGLLAGRRQEPSRGEKEVEPRRVSVTMRCKSWKRFLERS